MGKKKQDKNKPKQVTATLREEKIGKKHADVASIMRIKHLTRVATWASGEGQVNPLGSMLGQRLSATAELTGLQLDSSVLLCQKCETVLQPGFNCKIRIKKNKRKIEQCQNNVIYTCHFCSHDNIKCGTTKGTLKNILPSKSGLLVKSKNESESVKNPITPVSKAITPLIKDEKNNFSSKFNSVSSFSSSSINVNSSKRKRKKGWTSLKEKANSEGSNNFVVPFNI